MVDTVLCRAPLQETSAYVWKEDFGKSLEMGVRPQRILRCAHQTAFTGKWAQLAEVCLLTFGLSAGTCVSGTTGAKLGD